MSSVLFVTEQPNDRDLLKALGPIAISVPIPHGDVCFFGLWEGGTGSEPIQIRVSLERKRINDMVNSIMTGRYLSQAQAAYAADFNKLILIVEGVAKPGRGGLVEVPRRKGWMPTIPPISYSRFDQYLSELSLYAGITVKRTQNVTETAAVVKALWALFQKPPSDHSSLKSIYSAPPPGAVEFMFKPSLVRRVANQLSGIGWRRAGDADRTFCSVTEMVNADANEWEKVPGVGKKTAAQVVASIRATRA